MIIWPFMHTEILTKNQLDLLPLVKKFCGVFYLVGGTALALQLGHRRSIDFDLFNHKEFDNDKLLAKVRRFYPVNRVYLKNKGQMTIDVHGVRMTWYQYPFDVPYQINWGKIITMPDVPTIAAMKIYALGQRAKWKDYVDLYFIFQRYPFKQVIKKAKTLFGNEINERLVREQLNYFADIDYSETVEYLQGMAVDDEVIKTSLKKIAIS